MEETEERFRMISSKHTWKPDEAVRSPIMHSPFEFKVPRYPEPRAIVWVFWFAVQWGEERTVLFKQKNLVEVPGNLSWKWSHRQNPALGWDGHVGFHSLFSCRKHTQSCSYFQKPHWKHCSCHLLAMPSSCCSLSKTVDGREFICSPWQSDCKFY